MGGISYKINPLDTLKMVTASSIFAEPQYYRDGKFAPVTICDAIFRLHSLFKEFAVIGDHFEGKKTSEVMEQVIDEALDYDYEKTLTWAVTLRREYNMRLKTMCLSDNSGSAWGAFTSEYGRTVVAEIDNLSSVITARNSDEGYVGKFGNKLIVYPVGKRGGVLKEAKEISDREYGDVGGDTENGIWIFFRDAIKKKEHWDNIFIYSDMQAGHGGLYGTSEGIREYTEMGYACNGGFRRYVDVAKLIAEYRSKVNPKVNVFCVQTAGYTNVCVPEYGYRTCIMYGWTGKEALFADAMIRFWDEKKAKQ